MKQNKPPLPSFLIDLSILAPIAGFAFWLRFTSLQLVYFGIDEAFHLWFASRPTLSQLFTSLQAAAPQQFPLDYLINFVLFHFTHDLMVMRLLPVLWGTGSVIVFYFLGCFIWSRTFGAVCAWLLTISMFHIQYSQVLRPYSLVVFLSLASLYCFARALENKRWILVYAAAIFFYQMAYPYAFAMIALNIFHVNFFRVEHRWKFNISMVLSLLLLFSWFFLNGKHLFHGSPFSYKSSESLGWEGVGKIIRSFSQYRPVSVSFYGVLFLTAIGAGLKNVVYRNKVIYGCILMLVTLTMVGLSISRAGLFFEPRHAIVILPIFLAFVAAGIFLMGIFLRFRPFILGVCFSFLLLLYPVFRGALDGEIAVSRFLREAAGFMRDNVAFGDTIILSNPNMGGTFLYSLDPNAFFKIEDVYLHQGFNLFRFPQNFRALAEKGGIPIYALCSIDKESATMNRTVFDEVLKGQRLSGGRIWCVYNQVNYILEPNPFFPALGLKPEHLELKYPGIYLLKM